MATNKRLMGLGAAASAAVTFTPSEHFNTVLYTGNGGTQRIGGYINRGAVFNGSSSGITLPKTILNNGALKTFSISLWFQTSTTSEQMLVSTSASSSNAGINLNLQSNGYLIFQMSDGSSNTGYMQHQTDMSDGDWHHVVVTYSSAGGSNDATTSFYLDGTDITSSVASGNSWSQGSGSTFSSISHLALGRWPASSLYYLNGKLDQVRFFNKALSQSEVTTLNGETFASTTISTTDIFNDNSGVALYQLDGNANDTGGASGKFGAAAIFNGSSSVIQASGLNQFFNNWNDASWSAWINTTDTSAQYIACESTDSQNYKLIGSISSNKFQIVVRRSGTVYSGTSTTTMNDGNWHHIAATYESSTGTVKGYIDGSEEISFSTGGASSATFSVYDFCIGANKQNSNVYNPLDGIIDEVRIYSDVLTSTEVGYIYNNTTASIPTDNLEAYYKLNGDARDETVPSYDGVASNVTYAYDGTASNVTYQEATKFTPDLVWIKRRDSGIGSTNHLLFDSVRGAGERLMSNHSNGESTETDELTSFDSNGFTVGADASTNGSGGSIVAWCFNAGSGSAALNQNGDIDSNVKANTDAGFSIVEYTGNGSYGQTVGHGLGVEPKLVIIKNRSNARNWRTYVSALGATKFINLDESAAAGTYGSFNDTDPTTDVFSTTSSGAADRATNYANDDYIAYCFADVADYQKIGTYDGNGSTNGTFVETGFEPAFLLIKRTDGTNSWAIHDNKRATSNPRNKELFANLSDAESTFTAIDFLSNGFQLKTSNALYNGSSNNYIYLAIAADPDTTTPTVADSFDVVTYSGSSSSQNIDVDFKADLVFTKARNASYNWGVFDSIRGAGNWLQTNTTDQSFQGSYGVEEFNTNSIKLYGNFTPSNYPSTNYVAYLWKAGDHDDNLPQINTEGTIDSVVSVNAEAGFSIVKYTGNGTSGSTIGHGLSSTPSLIIWKNLDATSNWLVYSPLIGSDSEWLYLNLTTSKQDSGNTNEYPTNKVNPTSSVVTVNGAGSSNNINISGQDTIMYCFHSVTGYQKVGKYTGTGVSGLEVSLSFSPRFLLVKGVGATGWILIDSQRGSKELYANLSDAEDASATAFVLGTNKFTVNSTGTWHNSYDVDYIYLAIK